MLTKNDLKPGVLMDLPLYGDRAQLIKMKEKLHYGRRGDYWFDDEGRVWAEDYILAHGRIVEAPPTSTGAAELTSTRKSTHGDWAEQSRVFDNIMHQLTHSANWNQGLNHIQRAALTNIAQKMSRIVTGDPSVDDHWDDIGGYAFLGKGGHK